MNEQTILIVVNDADGRACDAAMMLGTYFMQLGLGYEILDSRKLVDDATLVDALETEPREYMMAVVLGGDGTILRTASYLRGGATPILGINFGHLGFLSNPATDGVIAIVAAALAGDVTEEIRSNVTITVDFGEDASAAPEGKIRRTEFFALNEVTIERGPSGRVVDMSVLCDGTLAYKMRGDGVVIASATGSTAYALSAGGPMMAPGNRGLVVVPLNPHTLSSRAMVTQPGDVVEIVLTDDPDHDEVTLFLDGRPLAFDAQVRRVYVTAGGAPTRLLRYKYDGFYADVARVFFHEGN